MPLVTNKPTTLCCNAECHYAECLSVVMLNIVAPFKRGRPPKLNMFMKLINMHSYFVLLLYSSIKMGHFGMLKSVLKY
jgi:hypothetical protein